VSASGISGTGNGGAILNSGINSLLNVTVALNAASGGHCADGIGGAIDNDGRFMATNCTIWANTAAGGSNDYPVQICYYGGRAFAASINARTNGMTFLLGSIVGNPTSTSNCLGEILDGGHNICSDSSCSFTNAGSLNGIDPKLGALTDNGGRTLTLGLEPGSPAIDAIAVAEGNFCPATDQRGASRPIGLACDIGAFEGTEGLGTFFGISRLADGRVQVDFHGLPQTTYVLQRTSDLINWSSISTNQTTSGGMVEFIDTNAPARFYRMRGP